MIFQKKSVFPHHWPFYGSPGALIETTLSSFQSSMCLYRSPGHLYRSGATFNPKKSFCCVGLSNKKTCFFFFSKNWLQTYIDGQETYIGTWSFENQCLKWHRELQGSHRRANGAKILIFFLKIWIFGGAAFFDPKILFFFRSILGHAAALGDLQGVFRIGFFL